MAHGIEADMQKMTQAEKTMLRYQYVLANTGAATDDFQRTIGSWANQLRLLTGNFEQLGSIVGGVLVNAFKPFIQALNSVMGAVISFAQVVSDALGAIFGWEYQTGGGVAQDLEFGAGAAEDIEEATGGAAKNAKELNRYIAAWHEVNNMTSNDGGSGGGSGGGGAGGAASGNADGGQWVQAESLWEKYTSDIDSLYELGAYIGEVLTKAMNDIDWDSVYESARNFGTGLASFLNGLISPELFGATGRTIAGALNTAIYAALSFGETFDWKDFGLSIATGINGFFRTFDFASLAQTINVWAKGLLDTVITGIDNTDWEMIGTRIGTFLENIDFLKIGGKIGKAIWKAINAGFDMWKGMFSAAPLETALLSLVGVTKLLKASSIKKFSAALKDLTIIAKNLGGAFVGIPKNLTNMSAAFPGLTKAVNVCGTAFQQLMFGVHYGDWSGGLNQALNTIRTNLTGIQKMAITAVSGFAEFRLVKDSISDLATGTGSLAGNLAELASGAAIGAAGMYVAFGPSGLAMAAVVGLIAAVQGIDSAMKEKTGYNDMLERFDVLNQEADELNRQCRYIKENLDTMRDDYEKTGEAQATVAENLASKYDLLHSKANPTAADIELMKRYSQDLIKIYPELEQFFNNETGLLDATRGSIQDVIDKNKELALSNAALSGMEDAYKAQIEASQNLQRQKEIEIKKQDELKQAQEKWADYLEKHPTYATTGNQGLFEGDLFGREAKSLQDAIKVAGAEVEAQKENVREAEETVKDAVDTFNYFSSSYDETVRNTIGPSKEITETFSEVGAILETKFLKEIENAGEGAVKAMHNLFVNLQSGAVSDGRVLTEAFQSLGVALPTAFVNAFTDQTDASVQNDMVQFFGNLASGIPQSAESLGNALLMVGIQLPEKIMLGLEEGTAAAQNDVVMFLGQLKSGVELTQPELETLFYNLGVSLPSNLAEALADNNSIVQESTLELLAQIEAGEEIKDETLKSLFNGLGIEITDSMIQAFKGKEGDLQSEVITLLNQIEAGKKVKDVDLIKLFSSFGQEIPTELINSIQSLEGDTYQQAISLLMQLPNATDEMKDEILRKLNDLGIDASGSYNTGLASNNDNIQKTAEEMRDNTKQPLEDEFKNTNSGSMYDAGANASKGFWQGLKDWWDDSWLNRQIQKLNNTITGKKGLDEHSPSAKWYGYAALGVEGFNNGLKSEFPNTYSLVDSWLLNMQDGLKGIELPVVDVSIDTSKYKFNPPNINAGKISGQIQEELDYMFAAGGFIDYDRLGEAVYRAQSQAMKENPVQIGDKDVFSAAQRQQRREYRRTFKTGWAGID